MQLNLSVSSVMALGVCNLLNRPLHSKPVNIIDCVFYVFVVLFLHFNLSVIWNLLVYPAGYSVVPTPFIE